MADFDRSCSENESVAQQTPTKFKLLVGAKAKDLYVLSTKQKTGRQNHMSVNPNAENRPLYRLQAVSIFILFVIAAAVLITATGIIVDELIKPTQLLKQ
jgi:hypothetical protein